MKILHIGDDAASTKWTVDKLGELGFMVQSTSNPTNAAQVEMIDGVRAVLVEIAANRNGALSAVRILRRMGVEQPIVVLAPQNNWRDAIASLDTGADDYLVKPIRSDELAARLRAIIRRCAGNATDQIVLGEISLDLKARCAWLGGHCLNLTRNEFRLLMLFLLQPDRIMTHREIHSQLNPEGTEYSHNAIEVQIARLRRKVGKDRICTVRGVGYRLVPDFSEPPQPDGALESCRSRTCDCKVATSREGQVAGAGVTDCPPFDGRPNLRTAI